MPKIGNPQHWFGEYYLSGDTSGKFILYNARSVIKLNARTYKEALKEANIYGRG